MKNNIAVVGLVSCSLLVLAAGCGKTDSTSPTSPPATQPATALKVEPAPTENAAPVPQKTNTVAMAQDTAKAPVGSALKAADTTATAASNTAAGTIPTATAATNQSSGVLGQAAGLAGLSQDQMVRGLEEALAKGLQQAVARLGHDGGFLTNLNVKIPMPEKLQKVETALRTMQQDKLADDFVSTMNHAAEQAVPEAAGVFADTLKQMTIGDAKSILAGPNDAATQYFQKTTQTNLYARFYPIVQKATEKTGVTAAYKSMVAKADVTRSLGSFGSALTGSVLDKDSMDVDAYVTNKAMDGLFKMVAEEEKQIRQNPVARTTDMLQKVFGALKR